MKAKKFNILLTVALAATLAACGGDKDNNQGGGAPAAPAAQAPQSTGETAEGEANVSEDSSEAPVAEEGTVTEVVAPEAEGASTEAPAAETAAEATAEAPAVVEAAPAPAAAPCVQVTAEVRAGLRRTHFFSQSIMTRQAGWINRMTRQHRGIMSGIARGYTNNVADWRLAMAVAPVAAEGVELTAEQQHAVEVHANISTAMNAVNQSSCARGFTLDQAATDELQACSNSEGQKAPLSLRRNARFEDFVLAEGQAPHFVVTTYKYVSLPARRGETAQVVQLKVETKGSLAVARPNRRVAARPAIRNIQTVVTLGDVRQGIRLGQYINQRTAELTSGCVAEAPVAEAPAAEAVAVEAAPAPAAEATEEASPEAVITE